MAAADGHLATTATDPSRAGLRQPGLRQKVFVSYSRSNTAIADEIVAGLEFDGGFEVFLDRHSIHEGEVWRERLAGLIASADTIVFLLSTASAGSELCRWEVDHAQSLSKRIIPALIEKVESAAVPPALTALQYVRFDEGSFMTGLAGLREALRADLDWVREHTRLLTRAQEWDLAGRIPNRLLSGPDIVAAKAWIEHRPQDAPAPLELHRDFIAASEQAEAARAGEDRKRAQTLKDALGRSRVALIAAIAAGVVAAGVGAWAYVIGVRAETAAQERDDFIAGQEKAIAQLKAQLAASAAASLDVDTPPLPSVETNGPARPAPSPAATPSPAPEASQTPSSGDISIRSVDAARTKQVADLMAEADGLKTEIAKLADVHLTNPVLPDAPVVGAAPAAADLVAVTAYVESLRQERARLIAYVPVQQKAPGRYAPVLIPKK